MGPPGAYARHRAPHPLQQQPQYPTYQPPTDNMYGLSDQHTGMGMAMGDLGGWGAAAAAGQPGPYGAPAMGYGHPQPPQQQQQRQPQSSSG